MTPAGLLATVMHAVIPASTGESLLVILLAGDLCTIDRWRENFQSRAAEGRTANAIAASGHEIRLGANSDHVGQGVWIASDCRGNFASKQGNGCSPLSGGLLHDTPGLAPVCKFSVQVESRCWFDDLLAKTVGCFCTRQATEFDWRYTSGETQSKEVVGCCLSVASGSLGGWRWSILIDFNRIGMVFGGRVSCAW